jgi:hypothetical protein
MPDLYLSNAIEDYQNAQDPKDPWEPLVLAMLIVAARLERIGDFLEVRRRREEGE